MYFVEFSKESLKQLKKLPKFTNNRIISTIKRIRIRPVSHVKKIVGSKYFRLRVGDYRVIMDIIDNKLVIMVIDIKHRKNIYKKIT